ncbi:MULTISPECIES: hypothetical protein [unclassified Chryseobacterium]|uniref:hypothetical protein n=1 Tax=unclassified Chryseobacterium TaxID=2593645 RepID=UPI000D716DF5|nr:MULTISPECIES: hypothetical protein [unclassified Chryseobacterium]PWW25390.1 hypothetical protein DEU40_112122 [Chryseobacterium sp. AG844]RKE81854.1 hypothetical protein DEU39_1396 [Chryseobacterium sp. AG363]
MKLDIDIQNVIEFIIYSLPEDSILKCNLENISPGKWHSKAYYQFVDSTHANTPGSKWIFKENIILEHPKLGTLVLDILEKDQLGGIEFYELL